MGSLIDGFRTWAEKAIVYKCADAADKKTLSVVDIPVCRAAAVDLRNKETIDTAKELLKLGEKQKESGLQLEKLQQGKTTTNRILG